jgi:hypothetical protein
MILCALLCITIRLAAPSIIRKKISAWGQARGYQISYQNMSMGIGRGELLDVIVTGEGLSCQLQQVKVKFSLSLQVQSVEAKNGRVKLEGIRQKQGSSSGKSGLDIQAEGINFIWTDFRGEGSALKATDAWLKKSGPVIQTGASKLSVISTQGNFDVEDGRAEIIREPLQVKLWSRTINIQPHFPEHPAGAAKAAIMTAGFTEDFSIEAETEIAVLEYGEKTLFASGPGLKFAVKRLAGNLSVEGTAGSLEYEWIRVSKAHWWGSIQLVPEQSAKIRVGGDLTVDKPQLADMKTTIPNIEITGQIVRRGTTIEFNDGDVHIGDIPLVVSAHKSEEGYGLKAEVKESECGKMLESIRNLVPALDGMKLGGKMSTRVQIEVNGDKDPEVQFTLDNHCIVTEVPSHLNVSNLRKPFKKTFWDADGKPFEAMTGPNTDGWTPISQISTYMTLAAIMTEDPGYRHNKGFDVGAIQNSIRDNIKTRKFLRGASTITMQLAKNLWLDRSKNLSRKLQEAIMTVYLEQEFDKEKIMETYLNIVEYAPGVYGIGKAARLYFKTTPNELTLSQCLFLSLMLPKPKGQYFERDGKLKEKRMQLIYVIMINMMKKALISEDEYNEGMSEWVVKGEPRPDKVVPGTMKLDRSALDVSDWE